MPTFKLDGRDIPFTPGETIISAAYKQGIEIPHYCWHPGLSIAANCRMCLVEIDSGPGVRKMMLDVLQQDPVSGEWKPASKVKLQPSCQVPAAEGLVVRSETSDEVKKARAHVQEFLLLNHPVDCPICDQAGECKLQDYYMSEQATPKRMREEPNHKPKSVVFGPTIVYDAERCIACTRCIRFCEEVTQDPVLEMRERGNLFEITVAPGRVLDGKYTMMTESVCPVGALTTSHWRHRGRVWLLKGSPSVCPGCATGCNMYLDVDSREQSAFRCRPRENVDVNKYWMCDDGMLTYNRVGQDRLLEARSGRGKQAKKATVKDALDQAATVLGKAGRSVAVVLSAQFSSEDNLAAVKFAEAIGTTSLYLTGRASWDGDNILRNADQNPNRAGALQVAGKTTLPGMKELLAKAAGFDAIVVLGTDSDVSNESLEELQTHSNVIVFASHTGTIASSASIAIPVTSWAESNGTFVNAKNMAQQFKRALPPQGDALPAWDAIARIARAMKLDLPYRKFNDVRDALTERTSAPLPIHLDESLTPDTRTPRSSV